MPFPSLRRSGDKNQNSQGVGVKDNNQGWMTNGILTSIFVS